MLSVIVPVYNTEKYLACCIDSILVQTLTDFELLLINDGSTDKSGEICNAYAQKDSRIRVFHQKNNGVSNARCKGVENANGEYITFVDADDKLYENSLETLMKNMSIDIDIVSSGAPNDETVSSETFIKYILTGKAYSSIWGRLFKKSLFTSYVADIQKSILIGEDQLMNIKLVLGRDVKIKCIKENVYVYRSNPDSVTNTKRFTLEYEEFYMNERVKVIGKYKDIFMNELHYNNINTLENLIVCRVAVPYNRPWVKELIAWGKEQKLSLRHWMVLNVRNNLLCKYLLAIEKRMRKVGSFYPFKTARQTEIKEERKKCCYSPAEKLSAEMPQTPLYTLDDCSMYKISVVVPVYNSESTLRRCVDSILAQTFTDFELLLVDDGSTDSSRFICYEYEQNDSRVRVFHQTNGGLSSARNAGIDHAKGEWITFCDSDDYVNPNWLNTFAENCTGNDLVVQGFITDKQNIITGVNYTGNAQGCFWLLHRNFILGYVWVKLFRRDLMRKYNIRFNEDFKFLEDEDFVVRYLGIATSVTCTKMGGYVYDMPDFVEKYSGIDNFHWSCEMFRSVQKLTGGKPVVFYLNELTKCLFHSFKIKKADRCKRLKTYQQLVGKDVMYTQINILSKLVLLVIRSPKIASWIFDFKP